MHKRKFSVLWSDIIFLHTQHHPSAHTAYICMYITVLYQSTPSPSPSLSCPPSHILYLHTHFIHPLLSSYYPSVRLQCTMAEIDLLPVVTYQMHARTPYTSLTTLPYHKLIIRTCHTLTSSSAAS